MKASLAVAVFLVLIAGCGQRPPDPADQAYSSIVGYINGWNDRDQSAVAASFVDVGTGAEMAEKSVRYSDMKYPTNSKIIVAANNDTAWVAVTDIYLPIYINGVKQPPKLIFQYYNMKLVGDKFKINYMSETIMDLLPSGIENAREGCKYFREYKDANQLKP